VNRILTCLLMLGFCGCSATKPIVQFKPAIQRAHALAMQEDCLSLYHGGFSRAHLVFESIDYEESPYTDVMSVTFAFKDGPRTNVFGQSSRHLVVMMKRNGAFLGCAADHQASSLEDFHSGRSEP
jgi:hypothetical protein